MKKVAISDILDHMVLAKPLNGVDGKILMAEGVELKESMIQRLKSWGVLHAYVQEDGEAELDEEPVDKSYDLDAVDTRFEGTLDHPNMMTLYQAIRDHMAERDK